MPSSMSCTAQELVVAIETDKTSGGNFGKQKPAVFRKRRRTDKQQTAPPDGDHVYCHCIIIQVLKTSITRITTDY